MNKHFIPDPDAAFDDWQFILMSNVASRAPAWNVPSDEVAAVQTLQTRWKNAYAAATNPATRTKGTVKEKREARKAYEKGLRRLIRTYLTYNPMITDKDREDIGLPVHKTTRNDAPVATTYPDFDIDSGTIRRLIIHFFDQGKKKSSAKPEGQHGAEIRLDISDMPVVDVEELTHSSFDTHTPLTLEFQGHERGKTVYFCLCWENTTGKKGPWSEIQSAIIP